MGKLSKPRPLSAEDDRAGFACGRSSLNQWFLRNAWRNQKADISRTTVVCEQETGRVAAYMSLASAEIRRDFLVKSQQRNKPEYVPVILLGQLAVDIEFQGHGLGRSLLLAAFKTALQVSESIGCYGVITHPLDVDIAKYYVQWGFEKIPCDPEGAMMVRMVDLRHRFNS